MKQIDLVVLKSDDWDAIYVNGELEYSGSENLVREILEIVSDTQVHSTGYAYVESGTPAGDVLEEYGDYPGTLAELPGLRLDYE